MGRLGAFVFSGPFGFRKSIHCIRGKEDAVMSTLSALVSESDCRTPSDDLHTYYA